MKIDGVQHQLQQVRAVLNRGKLILQCLCVEEF